MESELPTLRKMNRSDVPKVIKIIDAHDDDDAEAADDDLSLDQEDQYVYELNEKIIGVTGFRRVPATDNTCWISWTYLHPDHIGKGLGKAMLKALLEIMKTEGVNKIFVKVSDYEDPEDGKIYEAALALYKSLGFEHELTNADFYDEGENQLILSMRLGHDENPDEELEVLEEKPVMRFNGMFEIGETDGAYTFSWEVKDKKGFFESRGFTVEDLTVGLNAVKAEGGRKVFLTFPSNLPLVHRPLQTAGFKFVGTLEDYYEKGVHEYHFSHSLDH